MADDKFGGTYIPPETRPMPGIRPDEPTPEMGPANLGAGLNYAPYTGNAQFLKGGGGGLAGGGGGLSAILAQLLGGVKGAAPVGMPTPLAGPSTAAGGSPFSDILAKARGVGGVSPSLSNVLTGSPQQGGETNNIQALLAQLMKRPHPPGTMV